MTRLRTLLIAGGMALALPGVAAAQARDWEFCEKLTLGLSASHDAEPFNSLLQDQTQPKGYTTLVMPGFDRCFVGRMGAEPPGVPTFACRKSDAPPELTARALLGKVAVCMERTPDFDENGAAFFSAPPTHIRTEEMTFGDKRTVVFKVEVVEGPATQRRPVEEDEELPAGDPPAEAAPETGAESEQDWYVAPDEGVASDAPDTAGEAAPEATPAAEEPDEGLYFTPAPDGG